MYICMAKKYNIIYTLHVDTLCIFIIAKYDQDLGLWIESFTIIKIYKV